jgi:hypothetical protein
MGEEHVPLPPPSPPRYRLGDNARAPAPPPALAPRALARNICTDPVHARARASVRERECVCVCVCACVLACVCVRARANAESQVSPFFFLSFFFLGTVLDMASFFFWARVRHRLGLGFGN